MSGTCKKWSKKTPKKCWRTFGKSECDANPPSIICSAQPVSPILSSRLQWRPAKSRAVAPRGNSAKAPCLARVRHRMNIRACASCDISSSALSPPLQRAWSSQLSPLQGPSSTLSTLASPPRPFLVRISSENASARGPSSTLSTLASPPRPFLVAFLRKMRRLEGLPPRSQLSPRRQGPSSSHFFGKCVGSRAFLHALNSCLFAKALPRRISSENVSARVPGEMSRERERGR
jgi:hypothetical protein